MKAKLTTLILFVSIFCCLSFKEPTFSGSVELKMGKSYYSSLLEDINSAQKSIYCAMYLIKFDAKRKNDPTTSLLDALINAKKRGVAITMIVDHNKKFWAKKTEKDKLESKSEKALEYLLAGGVDVYLDSEDHITHSKVVVIDKKITYIGSSNWTYSALKRNHETNIKLQDETLAHELQQQLNKLKVRAYDQTAK